MVGCFVGSIAAAAFGVWWLAAMLFVAGLLLASIDAYDEHDRRHFEDLERQHEQLMREVRRRG